MENAVVLLVEESIGELYTFEKALRHGGFRNPVRIVRHAQEARCYLEGVGVYGNREAYPLPSLILINLRLRPDGAALELITAIRRQPHLRDRPIIALGAQETGAEEIQRLYDLGINAYFAKELEVAEIVRVLKEMKFVEEIWQRA